MLITEKIKQKIYSSDNLSNKIKSNVAKSLITKIGSVIVNFGLVSILIDYINPIQYGIWITVSSVISWIGILDIGLGNGLRNQLTIAISEGDYKTARKYVSTTYCWVIVISSTVLVVFLPINYLLNWNEIYGVKSISLSIIQKVNTVLLFGLCAQLIMQTITSILFSFQRVATANFIVFFSQFSILIVICTLKKNVEGNIEVIAFVYALIPNIVYLLFTLYFFTKDLIHISPSMKEIDLSLSNTIINKGLIFFLLQVGSVILMYTDSFIINKVAGPEEVTKFNVSTRLFSTLSIAFAVIITPYWSAFTEAFSKNDGDWVEKNLSLLRKIWLVFSFVFVPLLFLLSNFVFHYWLGDDINIEEKLLCIVALYTISQCCLSLSSYFLNGIGNLKIQLYLYIISSVSNIPLSFKLGEMYGTAGIVFATFIITSIMNLVLWKECNRTVKKMKLSSTII
ncbi:lipopolysaccharide biosynthesis protein [Spirosoma pomorum]